MNKDKQDFHDSSRSRQADLEDRLARKVKRKLEYRNTTDRSVFFWMGLFGLVGWSISVPLLIGIALGKWLDSLWPSDASWTLMLLLAGLIIGCWNAWHWIKQELHHD